MTIPSERRLAEKYFNKKGDLTDTQEEILERIYEKKSR